MTLTLDQLLADWTHLGDDSIGKHTRKALNEAGITPAAAATMPKKDLAAVPGLGVARLERAEKYLRDLADRQAKDAANAAREAGKGKPGHCPDCGDPRATQARNVAVDMTGCARHVVQPGELLRPFCADCDAHHRALVADRALELAGRLA